MDNKLITDGIILDIDGTIWDSTGIVSGAWTRAAAAAGSKRRENVTADELKRQFGKPMDEIAEMVFPEDTPEMKKKILDMCCRYEHMALEEDPCDVVFDGVVETIRQMSGKYPFFIVSNCQKGYIELVCKKTGITPLIRDHVCFGATGMGKAENLKLLVKRNGLLHPVYIGDTEGDRIACDKAGIPFIYASYGFGNVEQGNAAAVIDSFDQIRTLFSGLKS